MIGIMLCIGVFVGAPLFREVLGSALDALLWSMWRRSRGQFVALRKRMWTYYELRNGRIPNIGEYRP